MPHFAIENLRRDQLLEAWPVARTCAGHFKAEWWVNDASLLLGRGGGVLAARASDQTIHGIATYQPIDSRRGGRILAVEALATFELTQRAPVRRALCKALDSLSLALGCDGIVFGSGDRSAQI